MNISYKTLVVSLSLSLCYSDSGVAQQRPRYSAVNLGSATGVAINDRGLVAVERSNPIRVYTWERWKKEEERFTDIGSLGGRDTTLGRINNSDMITGSSNTRMGDSHAYLKIPGQGMQSLNALPGDQTSIGMAINAEACVVGYSYLPMGGGRAFLKCPGEVMLGLGSLGGQQTWASGINANRAVVGMSQDRQMLRRAFRKLPGQPMQDIGTLGGNRAEAYAINDRYAIVGESLNAQGIARAFLKRDELPMEDLGAIPGLVGSSATNLNNPGQIIGYAYQQVSRAVGFLWEQGLGMQKLDDLVAQPPWRWLKPTKISNRGEIVGIGTSINGRSEAFLLVPNGQAGVMFGPINRHYAGTVNITLRAQGQEFSFSTDLAQPPTAYSCFNEELSEAAAATDLENWRVSTVPGFIDHNCMLTPDHVHPESSNWDRIDEIDYTDNTGSTVIFRVDDLRGEDELMSGAELEYRIIGTAVPNTNDIARLATPEGLAQTRIQGGDEAAAIIDRLHEQLMQLPTYYGMKIDRPQPDTLRLTLPRAVPTHEHDNWHFETTAAAVGLTMAVRFKVMRD